MIDFEQFLRAAEPEMLPRGDNVVEQVAQSDNGDDDVIDLCPNRLYPSCASLSELNMNTWHYIFGYLHVFVCTPA